MVHGVDGPGVLLGARRGPGRPVRCPIVGTAALVARLLVAGVLMTAAVAKLVDLDAFATANRNLGVPDRLVRVMRVAVPAIELVLAVGLLVTPTARVAAGLTVLLFAAFTALLVWNLARGRRPACNCFGNTGDEPISWWTVVRNVLLGLLAALAATGPSGIPAWIDDSIDPAGRSAFGAVFVGALVVAAALTVGLVRTRWQLPARRRRSTTEAAPGLPVGTDAAELLGEVRRRGRISGDLPTVVVRTDPSCGPCQALLPRLLSWQSAYAGLVDFAVLTGEVGEDPIHYDQVEHLVTDGETLAGRLGLDVTPSAVLVDGDGAVASTVAAGGIEIGHLVSDAVRDEDAQRLLPGDPANGVVMANGHGMLSLADLQGAMTLLVFWDPWCGFCQRGLLSLLQWQESIDGTGQRLLVAGQRDEEVTRLQGFQLVGADIDGSVMRLFGGEGTPSAVLIDAAGRVASDIAHGMDEVTALAERSQLLTSLGAPPPA